MTTTEQTSTDLVAAQFEVAFIQDAASLRRALRRVIAEAQATLDRMDEGSRPSTTVSGEVLGQTARDAENAAIKVATGLNFAGSPLLSVDAAIAALRGER